VAVDSHTGPAGNREQGKNNPAGALREKGKSDGEQLAGIIQGRGGMVNRGAEFLERWDGN